MSLATVAPAGAPSLSDLVDGLALRTGAWVVVERCGTVLAHGAGTSPCPEPLVQALLGKATAPLRAAVRWGRGGRRMTGTVGGAGVTVADLGAGLAAWFVGGPVEEAALPLLAVAAGSADQPVTDPVVAELLHPRGPARRGRAPGALLVALRSDEAVAVLAARAAAAVAGTGARVHAEDDTVLLALAPDDDAESLVARVRAACPSAVAGAATVRTGASDWVTAARLASGAARAAGALGLALADAAAPAVAAELVLREAQEAVADLVHELPEAPLQRLLDHDARTSADLVASLTAWCRAGFDVPAAAAVLHVHANTLRYRLKRAGEVSGLDLARPRQLLALQLLLGV